MRYFLALLLDLCLAAPVLASEDLTLTSPITSATWRVQEIRLNWDKAFVNVLFKDENTPLRQVICSETGPAALSLMSTLNTANLTSNSLQKRALNWAIGKGCLGAGTIAGTPE